MIEGGSRSGTIQGRRAEEQKDPPMGDLFVVIVRPYVLALISVHSVCFDRWILLRLLTRPDITSKEIMKKL